ncbi:MAG: hypothetical protein NPIRA03_25570 [Nitrospirales bacterium]|nr:MAG: hypothetical protein NPIRA03_25570 [Nitrospirales bacterium]
MAEETSELALDYTVQCDPNGVVDGRSLAKEMIGDAFKLLATYGYPCIGCCSIFFNQICDEVLAEMDQARNTTGQVPTLHFCMKDHGGKDQQNKVFLEHVEKVRGEIKKAIKEGRMAGCHQHGEGGNA